MKPQFFFIPLKWCLFSIFMLTTLAKVWAEGSKDFRDYPGYRLFFNAEQRQQLKVYAAAGEFINIGTSHVGISGGFIAVYRPDGKLHFVFNGSDGLGSINNDVEEMAGPTGGGTTDGAGYIPAVVNVAAGQSGIWTVRFEYPTYSRDTFQNLMNNEPWNRFDQPLIQRVVLAWDITVSQGNAGNMGGAMVEGRVYSNEYISIQNGNGIMTSPSFYVLTKDGFQYRIDFKDTDPWGFPIFSNSVGLTTPDRNPCYRSSEETDYNRSARTSEWEIGNKYLYEPQAQDEGNLINNKIFFNLPDPNMPAEAMVTDLLTFNTHTTWLFRELLEVDPEFNDVDFTGDKFSNSVCVGDYTTEVGRGGSINFKVNTSGTAKVSLDLDANGSFDDPADKVYFQRVEVGENSVKWDGKDGLGDVIPARTDFRINYKLEVRGGEIHIMMLDVENNPGGVTFTRLNGTESPSNEYFYDHSAIGGGVSGDGEVGDPRATVDPFTYSEKFGNNQLLDYWSYISYSSSENGGFAIDIYPDCAQPILDFDQDLIPDFQDIDDDNDGIADFSEYCNPEGDFVCMPGGVDPSADNDGDNIPNYLDSSDPAVPNNCRDANEDGICDILNAIYDTDGDGVPDHLDLDSDNDGITDLVEAGHQQMDADGNGVIDGDPSFFGRNGLFNAIASDADALTAFETYTRYDSDKDGVPDHDDLDSDNDGIHDIVEGNFGLTDSNDDGRIDNGNGSFIRVSVKGLAIFLDPDSVGIPIPLPFDTDLDGVPDWHDLDSDNDGINDVVENIKTDSDNDGIIGKGAPIVDANGKATASSGGEPIITTSQTVNTDNQGEADFRDLDADGDGINDVNEADHPDGDNDGRIGVGNPLVNEQGQIMEDAMGTILMAISNPEDTDADKMPDFQDIDRDGDGITDIHECPGGWPCINSDNDLLPDVDDLDSDNDLLTDKEECPGGYPCPDTDNNTVSNYLEYDCNNRNTPTPSQPLGGGQFCEGTPITLNASGDTAFTEVVSFQWTGPNNFEFSEEAPANSTFPVALVDTRQAASGTYELVLETSRGCQSTPLKVVVDLMETLAAPELSVEKEKLCAGESLTLATNTYSGTSVEYIWYQQTDGNPIPIDTTNIATLIIEETKANNAGVYTVEVNVNGCASSISNAKNIQVQVPFESPVATSSATFLNPACEGETVTLSVPTIEGATYEWTGPSNFSALGATLNFTEANTLDNGNYSAMITKDGCTVTTNSVMISVNPKPTTPSLTMEEIPQCEGGEATLKIIEPVSYPNNTTLQFDWYTVGNNTPISTTKLPSLALENLSAEDNGDYYVEVSLLGCASTASNVQNINVRPSLNVNATSSATINNPACEGEMVRLTGAIFNEASYAWFGPTGLISDQPSTAIRNASPDANGEYKLVVSLDGCTSTSNTVQVKVNPKPSTPNIVLDNTEPCTGENVTIRIDNAGVIDPNSTVTVDWYNQKTNELVTTTEGLIWQLENLEDIDAGAYFGVLTIDGCASEVSNIQQITTQPGLAQAEILTNAEAGVSPVCEGSQVNLAVPFEADVRYQWYGPNGIINNTSNNLIIENAPASTSGAYYVVREKAGCSRISETVNIKVGSMPEIPALSVVEGPQCLNGEVTLNITNPQEISSGSEVMYSWYHVQTNEQVGTSTHPIFTLTDLTEDMSGTYYAILTVDGCSTPPSNVASVLVQAPSIDLVATASAGIVQPVCEGESISLNVPFTIGATYEWYGPNGFTSNVPNPTISEISTEEAGAYYAVVTSNICPVLTNELILQVSPKPTSPNLVVDNVQNCEGGTAAFTITSPTVFPDESLVTYEWFRENSDASLATTTSPTLERTGLTTNDNGNIYAVVTQDGCISERSNPINLEVSEIPEERAFIRDEVTNICAQADLKIEAVQPMMGTGQWTTSADLSIVDPLNPSTFLLDIPAGNHTVYWTLSYKGCQDYSRDSIVVSQEVANITAQDDEFTIALNGSLAQASILENDAVGNQDQWIISIMNQPTNGKLTIDNGMISYEPDANFFGTDLFEYEICNINCPDNCDQASVQLKVVDLASGEDCFAPNIITPNNDGMNDYLKIPCVDTRPQSQLKVFNRWGDLVHETDNYKNNWAGTYKGSPLPNGTYFYLLQMSGSDDLPMQGYFTIVR